MANGFCELGLVGKVPVECVDCLARLVLDETAPQVDEMFCAVRHRHAGQLFAYHHGDGLLDRGVASFDGVLVVGAGIFIFQHGRQVRLHAGHVAGADGFAAGLFDAVIDGACGLAFGRVARMDSLVVAGKTKGHGIACTAGNGKLRLGKLAAGIGELDLIADQHRTVIREDDFQIALLGDGARAIGERLFQWLEIGRLGAFLLVVAGTWHRDGFTSLW